METSCWLNDVIHIKQHDLILISKGDLLTHALLFFVVFVQTDNELRFMIDGIPLPVSPVFFVLNQQKIFHEHDHHSLLFISQFSLSRSA